MPYLVWRWVKIFPVILSWPIWQKRRICWWQVASGPGKSVAVNAMLLSMLLKYTPEQLRLIMIDPKQLELANYNDIPHLLTPVVTDMKDAVSALNWCVNKMETSL